MRSALDVVLSLWWISWFGICSEFLWIGFDECRYEYCHKYASTHFSFSLLIIVTLLWIAFFVALEKTWQKAKVVVALQTMMGTFLAIFTLLGIFYFANVAPRVR